MRLDDWLAAKKLSHEAFADRLECDRASVTRYANGQRMPRPAMLARIERETDGAVTANDFVGAVAQTEPTSDEARAS